MTHDDRVYHHTYETLEGIAEHAERIASLEELVCELLPYVASSCPEECRYREECDDPSNCGAGGWPLVCVAYGHLLEAAREMGIEVEG